MLRTFRSGVKQGCLVAAPFLLLALLAYASGLDDTLAKLAFTPDTHWATWLRKYGVWAGQGLLVISLVALLVPYFGKKHPQLFHAALVTVITGIFAAGLFNQVILQALVDRPRPRESVLLQTPPQTELRGQSFPSGHASIGFLVAVPFMALNAGRKQKKKSLTLLVATGISIGLVMGVARMVLGAHFLSDVLFAGGTVLGTAAMVAPWVTKVRAIPLWLVAAVLFLGAAGMVLGNKFKLDLTLPPSQPWQRLELPCPVTTLPTPGISQPQVSMSLKGYGAPLSNLALYVDKEGAVKLQNRQGLYHSLHCTATILVPQE